jgi:hypothetical protein
MNAAGVDLGNQYTKAVFGPRNTETHRVMVLSSILVTEQGLARGNEDLSKKRTMLESLDLTITSKALSRADAVGAELVETTGRWLVGDVLTTNEDLAKQSLKAESNEKKSLNIKLYVSGLTALAVLAHRRLRDGEDTLTINVLTAGLPVDLCKDTDLHRKEVSRRLRGTHTVRFNGVAGVPDGRTIKIVINKVRVLPEGLGAALSQIYGVAEELRLNAGESTMDLKLKPVQPRLLEQTFMVFDLGGRTSDLVMVRPELDYDDQASEGKLYGVMDYLEAIVRDVRRAADDQTILLNEGHLLQYLENWDGEREIELPFYERTFPIKTYVDRHLRVLAEKVRDDLVANLTARVSAAFVVGGGAKVIQRYLERSLPERFRPVVHIAVGDPQWANAVGHLIFSITQGEA